MWSKDIDKVLNMLAVFSNREVTIEFEYEDGDIMSTSFYLFSKAEFEEGQLGYREDPEGNCLMGENEGDWKKDWFVVGYDVYLVGGCVRDLILKRIPKDFDILTSAELREVIVMLS